MKGLTQDEIEALEKVKEDVNITITESFSSFTEVIKRNLQALSSIFVALYFKSLNHDPKNENWKNRDLVFTTNNYSSIVRNIVKVHAGYYAFAKLEEYLKKQTFLKSENTFGDAIGHYVAARESETRHETFFYVVVSGLDLLNNISALEFILKNNMRRIIILAYTQAKEENINQENKLSGRLINLGFDTLVVSGSSPVNICDAINYAKRIEKPSVILANLN